ncbi:MAG: hypothetical protein JO149_00785 [Gammaproteobacteria bacterium]|nr:hypothetical protein [Gammaproteobacteria bacterium]
MSNVQDYYAKTFSAEKFETFKSNFIALCNDLITALENYIKPKIILDKTDPEKIQCAKDLLTQLSAPLNKIKGSIIGKSGASDWNCFAVYHAIITAKKTNEDICSAKRIALGRLADILNPATIAVFNKIFHELNETNDVKLAYLAAPKPEKSMQVARRNSGTLFVAAPAEQKNTDAKQPEVSSITIRNAH